VKAEDYPQLTPKNQAVTVSRNTDIKESISLEVARQLFIRLDSYDSPRPMWDVPTLNSKKVVFMEVQSCCLERLSLRGEE
jgi:hypothetical protein